MAGNIKGITIEFAANTTKLDKSIKAAEQNSRKLDKELQKVNKAIRFNPQSVELWSQKQQILTERIDETKKQLEALKKKQQQMDAAGIDKTSAEYRELEREIIETDSKLQHFQKQLKEIGNAKITALGNQFEAIGKKITTVGDNLTKKLTLPLVALGAGSFAAFKDVDKGMDAVVKKTGATGAALEEMQGTVKNLGTEIPTDFETIGNAVGEVNTRFGLSGQELEDLSGKFLKFARLNDTDVVTSIDDVQKALAAYGLDASSAGDYLDVLNATAQATGVDVNKLAQGIISNGAAFQEMGLDINQATYFMGQLEKSGANSETVLNGMRKALKNSAKDGKDLNESLAELEDSILNGKDGVDGLQKSYELFGKSGDQIYAALKNGSLSFKDLGDAAIDAGGNIDRTFGNTLDAGDQMKLTFNALKEAGAEIGASLGQVLVPMLKKASEALKKFAKWYNDLSPRTKELVTKLGLLAAAAGPILSIVGRMTTGVGKIIKLVPNVISGVAKLGTQLLTNPYLAIAAGATAAGAAIAYLAYHHNAITREYEKNRKAREDEIQGVYTQATTAELYAQKLDELSQKENKSAADKQLMQTYVDQLNGSVEGLNLTYDAEKDKLSQSTAQIYTKIAAYKDQAIAQAYQNQMQQVANDLVQTQIELDKARTQKAQILSQLRTSTNQAEIDALSADLEEVENRERQLTDKQNGLMSELDTYAQKASGDVKEIGTDLGDTASKASSEGANIGKGLASGVASGLVSGRELVKAVATQVINNAVASMKAAAGIASPSKVTRDLIGKNLGLGVATGLDASLGTVEKDARRFIDGTVNAMMATPPQMQVAGVGAISKQISAGQQAAPAGGRNVSQTINIYQPVSTPAETARAIRQQEIIQGLAG